MYARRKFLDGLRVGLGEIAPECERAKSADPAKPRANRAILASRLRRMLHINRAKDLLVAVATVQPMRLGEKDGQREAQPYVFYWPGDDWSDPLDKPRVKSGAGSRHPPVRAWHPKLADREIKMPGPDLPVMMVTAYGDNERRRRAGEYGATEFLTKPVDFALLKTQLLVNSR